MGARSGTACQRAASALRGASTGSPSATSAAGGPTASSSSPKSLNVSNCVFTGAFAASSLVLSYSIQYAQICEDARPQIQYSFSGCCYLPDSLLYTSAIAAAHCGTAEGGEADRQCRCFRTCLLTSVMYMHEGGRLPTRIPQSEGHPLREGSNSSQHTCSSGGLQGKQKWAP